MSKSLGLVKTPIVDAEISKSWPIHPLFSSLKIAEDHVPKIPTATSLLSLKSTISRQSHGIIKWNISPYLPRCFFPINIAAKKNESSIPN